jgi:hypothetical protein
MRYIMIQCLGLCRFDDRTPSVVTNKEYDTLMKDSAYMSFANGSIVFIRKKNYIAIVWLFELI